MLPSCLNNDTPLLLLLIQVQWYVGLLLLRRGTPCEQRLWQRKPALQVGRQQSGLCEAETGLKCVRAEGVKN